jgi:hypothetical protein
LTVHAPICRCAAPRLAAIARVRLDLPPPALDLDPAVRLRLLLLQRARGGRVLGTARPREARVQPLDRNLGAAQVIAHRRFALRAALLLEESGERVRVALALAFAQHRAHTRDLRIHAHHARLRQAEICECAPALVPLEPLLDEDSAAAPAKGRGARIEGRHRNEP